MSIEDLIKEGCKSFGVEPLIFNSSKAYEDLLMGGEFKPMMHKNYAIAFDSSVYSEEWIETWMANTVIGAANLEVFLKSEGEILNRDNRCLIALRSCRVEDFDDPVDGNNKIASIRFSVSAPRGKEFEIMKEEAA